MQYSFYNNQVSNNNDKYHRDSAIMNQTNLNPNMGFLNDRQFQNGRKNRDNDQLPVQNDYLQRYQMSDLQRASFDFNQIEQANVDRVMDKKRPTDGNLMDRNRDDAFLYGQHNPQVQQNQFIMNPVDTRKERFDLNVEREPIKKIVGYTHQK